MRWICVLTLAALQLFPGDAARGGEGRLRMFASVFSVRGSVAGSSTGRFGAFIRNGDDTTWQMSSLSNVYSWGLAYFAGASAPRYYLAAGSGVQRSTDGGKSWRVLTDWRLMESLSILPDPVDSAVLYTSTPGGVFRTRDDGVSWQGLHNGFRRPFVQSLAMDPRNRQVIYAAAEDDLYRSTDGGENWKAMSVGLSHVHSILCSPAEPDRIIVGAEEWGVRLSSDGGGTWRDGAGTAGIPIYALASSPDGSAIYAAGWESGVLRSTDGGESWQKLGGTLGGMTILSLAVHPENPRHLVAGADGEGVYESLDGGQTWSRAGLMGAKVTAIQFYP